MSFINLNKFYKKKMNLLINDNSKSFIKENSDKLKQDYIDFSLRNNYTKKFN